MAATNRPEMLDPALVRPGRFDRTIRSSCRTATRAARSSRSTPRASRSAPEVDLDALAATTSGFSGADLANVLNEAALLAIRAQAPADLERGHRRRDGSRAARRRRDASDDDEQRRSSPTTRRGTRWSDTSCRARMPHRVSVIPRGRTLGVALARDEDERKLHSRSALVDEMAALLGGRTAEELVFGEFASGASGRPADGQPDGPHDGLRARHERGPRRVALGDPASNGRRAAREHSDETARRMDDEIATDHHEAQRACARRCAGTARRLDERRELRSSSARCCLSEELERILGAARV